MYWKEFRAVAEDIGVMPGALFKKRYRVAFMIAHKWLLNSQHLCLFEKRLAIGLKLCVASATGPNGCAQIYRLAALVKSHGGERCVNVRTLAGTVEKGERKRSAAATSNADCMMLK